MEIEKLREEIEIELKNVKNAHDLENIRIKYLGKKGLIKKLFDKLKELEPERRKEVGKALNELKNFLESEIEIRKKTFEVKKKKEIDPTLPGVLKQRGYLHVLREELRRMEEIFVGLGFEVETGPEIESEFNNFEALNIPKWHPARDMQATLFLEKEVLLLRTHTSPIQIRTMLKKKPPIRIIAPGRVYRRDNFDASHSPVFHQVEGLYINKSVSFSNLKGTLELFLKEYFEKKDLVIKFEPSYFPFTEPSAEVSILWETPEGKRFLEIAGCGMVHPKVLQNCNIDPEEWNGYAFGVGVERLVMVKYKIPDIRLFFENVRGFLKQFSIY
ncbi:MAG: phenylalanine--tRNA ligase subunit alpha [Candidatus Hydrothermales bacterium]